MIYNAHPLFINPSRRRNWQKPVIDPKAALFSDQFDAVMIMTTVI